MKRIVITGMGVVSPLGNDLSSFWDALVRGESGVRHLSKLPSTNYKGNMLAAEVDWPDSNVPANLQEESNAVHYALQAAQQALDHAGLAYPVAHKNAYALIVGTTSGNQDILERTLDRYYDPEAEHEFSDEAATLFARMRPIRLSALVAKALNFGGLNMVIPTACAAGNYAIGTAYSMIQAGRTSVVVAGGADAFTRSCYTIFYRLGGMTHQDCRPFDQNRSGMVVGEGAGMLVLEDLEHALARGARIYAEVKGYGLSCDAYHRVAPDPEGEGAARAIRKALYSSNLKPQDIDLISAHGTGTPANDVQEAKALAKIFGENLPTIPVSGLKSMLGHCMGAASALEAIAATMSLNTQISPPTKNTEQVDPDFPYALDVMPGEARQQNFSHVLSNAFGFGGNICSVVLANYSSTLQPEAA